LTTPNPASNRRQLLSAGATVCASLLCGEAANRVSAGQIHKGRWIPPKELLEDLPRLMSVTLLPGISMAVVENGKVVWSHAVGVANTETREPVREDSIFEAASMSKPVFAYVVMKLVDEKRIDLDRPLVQYRKPGYLPDHPYIDLITARDVLRHSTGLPNWRNRPGDSMAPAFKPGSRWGYSGEGYFWLQLVVEQITGTGIDSVMRSRLFDPAGMTHSTFGWNGEIARLAVYGHSGGGKPAVNFKREMGDRFLTVAAKWGKPLSSWTNDDVVKALPEARSLEGGRPLPEGIARAPIDDLKLADRMFPNVAGGLSTTASEYARFMTLMLDHSKRAPWEISEDSRRAMLSQQMVTKANAIYWGRRRSRVSANRPSRDRPRPAGVPRVSLSLCGRTANRSIGAKLRVRPQPQSRRLHRFRRAPPHRQGRAAPAPRQALPPRDIPICRLRACRLRCTGGSGGQGGTSI
jgi:CubicO group peptidase (beta-lactamase class C family)